MLASLRSAAVFGVEAYPVHVEVDVAFGLPHFSMVGLPDATVRESRDRVRSAIRNSGFEFPPPTLLKKSWAEIDTEIQARRAGLVLVGGDDWDEGLL